MGGPKEPALRSFAKEYAWFEPLLDLVRQSVQGALRLQGDHGQPEFHDMHILVQGSEPEKRGAVFNDHQDRHVVERGTPALEWTATLVVRATGAPTAVYMHG